MIRNHVTRESGEKGKEDHFRDATKMVLGFNPIECDGFERAEN